MNAWRTPYGAAPDSVDLQDVDWNDVLSRDPAVFIAALRRAEYPLPPRVIGTLVAAQRNLRRNIIPEQERQAAFHGRQIEQWRAEGQKLQAENARRQRAIDDAVRTRDAIRGGHLSKGVARDEQNKIIRVQEAAVERNKELMRNLAGAIRKRGDVRGAYVQRVQTAKQIAQAVDAAVAQHARATAQARQREKEEAARTAAERETRAKEVTATVATDPEGTAQRVLFGDLRNDPAMADYVQVLDEVAPGVLERVQTAAQQGMAPEQFQAIRVDAEQALAQARAQVRQMSQRQQATLRTLAIGAAVAAGGYLLLRRR